MVEALVATAITWRGGRVAAMMISHQWVPCGVSVNDRSKFVHDVPQRLLASCYFSLARIPWSRDEVFLDLLVACLCCFVCSECHEEPFFLFRTRDFSCLRIKCQFRAQTMFIVLFPPENLCPVLGGAFVANLTRTKIRCLVLAQTAAQPVRAPFA